MRIELMIIPKLLHFLTICVIKFRRPMYSEHMFSTTSRCCAPFRPVLQAERTFLPEL